MTLRSLIFVFFALSLLTLGWGPTPLSVLIQSLSLNEWHPLLNERIPRLLVLAFTGAALSVAGLITQTLFNNPLASPGILGTTSGSSLATTIAILLGWSQIHPALIPVAALLGGFIALQIVIRHNSSLLLTGIALSTLLMAVQQSLLFSQKDNWQLLAALNEWTVASSHDRQWFHVNLSAPLILVGLYWTNSATFEMDYLLLGHEEAQLLGVPVAKIQKKLIWSTAFLVAGGTAALGHLPFIGLIVPHIIRQLNPPRHRVLFPQAALGGASLLLSMDLALRNLTDIPLQLGHIASLTGGVLLLILTQRKPCY